jgi:hypothetical protein
MCRAAASSRDVERAPAGDNRAAGERLLGHGPAACRRPEPVVRTDPLGASGPPLEELAAAVAEWVAGTIVRASDEAIQRHRQADLDIAHLCL